MLASGDIRTPAAPSDQGDLFVDESVLSDYADLYRDADPYAPPGPPHTWELNALGQPLWLLASPWAQSGGGWAVIVPQGPGVQVSAEVQAARALDRKAQGLGPYAPYGTPSRPRDLARVLAVGPAQMPAITWTTHYGSSKRGRRLLSRGEPETAACVAWLIDVRGWTQIRVADALFPSNTPYEGTRRARVRRHLHAGRRVLCDQGVWPWQAAPLDGPNRDAEATELPASWWTQDWVLAHLDMWHQVGRDLLPSREREVQEAASSMRSGSLGPPWY